MDESIESFDSHLMSMVENKEMSEQVTKIIAKNNWYNTKDSKGNTLMHYTIQYRNDKVLKHLVNSGSKVDVLDAQKRTPLMCLIELNLFRENLIEPLLESNADIYLLEKIGKTVLEMIGEREWLEKIYLELFLKKISRDCSNDREKIVEKLFAAKWPVYQVVQLKDAELAKLFLQYNLGAGINKGVGRERKAALHIAVERADVDNVKVLLEYNANVNVETKYKRQPLFYLYNHEQNDDSHKNLNILKMLLERTGNELIETRQLGSILEHGNEEAIKLLFEKNFDMMARVDYDDFIGHMLARNRHSSVILQLRNRKFEVDARNSSDETPLMIAAESRNAKAIEFLLDMGADIHAVVDSETALYYAVDSAFSNEDEAKDCVQILLERGSDVQIQNNLRGERTIFDIILDRETFLIGDLCIAHLGLQEARGTIITQLIRSKIESHKRFKDYFGLSKQQLKKEILKSISLFDLLTKTDKKLEQYFKNDDFVLKVEDLINSLSKNYYFCTILQKRVRKAEKSVVLKREASYVISKIMETNYERFPYIVDMIVDYLEDQDMKNLIDSVA